MTSVKLKNKIAIISVTDKSNLLDFASGLSALGFSILSTGGTAKALNDAAIHTIEVGSYTGQPEILDGRVKTLHPKIHGGILLDKDNPRHIEEAKTYGISPIDLVVVNLYQFREVAKSQNLPLEKAIEYIDIGGPTMLRAAAKNYKNSCPIIDPSDYVTVLKEYRDHGELSVEFRQKMARKVFSQISNYDSMIAEYFQSHETALDTLPDRLSLNYRLVNSLRYGENPHQQASFYSLKTDEPFGFASAQILQGKELSYNNLVDLNAAIDLILDFGKTKALAIIKHTNPCGIAISESEPLGIIYKKALAADPKSAFGGIIATNEVVDKDTATLMSSLFIECLVAPSFTKDALDIFANKRNLRLICMKELDRSLTAEVGIRQFQLKSIKGGLLVQTEDTAVTDANLWKVVTTKIPSKSEEKDLEFAMRVAKHVKSNAIVYAKELSTIAVGAGQMSRIDSANFAAEKATAEAKSLQGAVMASDAFFPFKDVVELAHSYGISAIVQPGGSIRDQESIEACNRSGISMVFTGIRHFRH